MYYCAQTQNPMIAKLGTALRYLESTALRFVPGSGHSPYTGLTNWSSGAGGISQITDVAVDSGQTGTANSLHKNLNFNEFGHFQFSGSELL
jgi:hypothetical protein